MGNSVVAEERDVPVLHSDIVELSSTVYVE